MPLHKKNIYILLTCVEDCVPKWHFPGTGYFPKKSVEISRPEHSGTSSSRSRLSTGIRDWLLPSLFQVWKHSGIPERFPNEKVILTVPTKKNPEWYCLKRFFGKSLKILYYLRLSQVVVSSPIPLLLL